MNVVIIAFGALLIGFSWLLSRDVPRVWRGERSRLLLPLPTRFFDVTHRSFAGVVAAFAGFGAAAALIGVAAVMWETEETPFVVGVAALGLGGFGLGAIVLAGMIEATNRPRFLVPPPLRNKPGSIIASRQRRERARRREAETDHEVVLIAVEPRPGSGISPYWFAICDDADCTWQSDTDDEGAARREARRHSSRTPRLERRATGEEPPGT